VSNIAEKIALARSLIEQGVALAQQGRMDDAGHYFQRALQIQPEDADAHNNLGIVLAQQGKFDEALAHYHEALRLKPGFLPALNNLAIALHRQGKLDEACAFYQQVLLMEPDHAHAQNNWGVALLEQERLDEAAECFHKTLRLQPGLADVHYNLGVVYREQGLMNEALAHIQEGLRLQPNARFRALSATLLPPIYQSPADVMAWRQRLTDGVRQLREQQFSLDLTNDTAFPAFRLVYQGFNDRDLQREIAAIFSAPRQVFRSAAHAKIKVAFLSSYFMNHTIGVLTRGLIAQLSRDIFEVTVLSAGRHQDFVAQFIQRAADHFHVLPTNLPAARRLIGELQLDVLFYTDLGMNPLTYSLAFSRLAPVQCVTWGHPVTTGIPTIDYFISCAGLETEESDQHYTERLVKLQCPAVYYYRPNLTAARQGRSHFGLPESGAVYACPQSLFKFHPDFDMILGDVLRRDPSGTLVLIEGSRPQWTELLRHRFAATLPDVLERVKFLPRQTREQFLNLNAVADVLLDPIHFGGGNTSYEALALGVPIITLPTKLLRGRITSMLYEQMNVLDCLVGSREEYVQRCVQLGADATYRAAVSAKIQDASDVLFANNAGVRELETFLQQAVARARGS
jgi:protein O-GlcNAc transferase